MQPTEQVDVHNLNQIIVINTLDPASRRILTVQIEGQELKMELDSEASFGIVSKETLHSIKPTVAVKIIVVVEISKINYLISFCSAF